VGVFRKTSSVLTVGLIDWRSAKDKTAAYTRGTRKHTRRMAKEMKRLGERPPQVIIHDPQPPVVLEQQHQGYQEEWLDYQVRLAQWKAQQDWSDYLLRLAEWEAQHGPLYRAHQQTYQAQ
jgi:hypothetical protein